MDPRDDLLQSMSNAVAGGVSFPVDAIAWALRKAKVPVGDTPVGGSKWMAEKGLTRPVDQGVGQVLGDTLGGFADPLGALGTAAKGGTALATLLPALPNLYRGRDALRAKTLASQIDLADELRLHGAGYPEIWDKAKLFKYPGKLESDAPNARYADWGFEVPPAAIDMAPGRDQVVNLQDVMDNEELYRLLPALREVRWAQGSHLAAEPVTGRGHYSKIVGPSGEIAMSEKIYPDEGMLGTSGYFDQVRDWQKTGHHEINHAINQLTKQRDTLGYAANELTPVAHDYAMDLARLLRQKTGKDDLADAIGNIMPQSGPQGRSSMLNWTASSGEKLAETAGHRANPGYNAAADTWRANNMPSLPLRMSGPEIPDRISMKLGKELYWMGRNDPLFSRPPFTPSTMANPALTENFLNYFNLR